MMTSNWNWLLRKAFLSLLAILWNSAYRCLYLSFSPLLFTSLLFTAICKASPDSHFAFLHFFSMGWKCSHSVMSDSSWPHGLQPTRLLHPWDYPGKSTGVGCLSCLACTRVTIHNVTLTSKKADAQEIHTHIVNCDLGTCSWHTHIVCVCQFFCIFLLRCEGEFYSYCLPKVPGTQWMPNACLFGEWMKTVKIMNEKHPEGCIWWGTNNGSTTEWRWRFIGTVDPQNGEREELLWERMSPSTAPTTSSDP